MKTLYLTEGYTNDYISDPNSEMQPYYRWPYIMAKERGLGEIRMCYMGIHLDSINEFGGTNYGSALKLLETPMNYPLGSTILLDIEGEGWRLTDDKENVNRMLHLIDLIRRVRPDIKIGNFCGPPLHGDYFYCNPFPINIPYVAGINKDWKVVADVLDFLIVDSYPRSTDKLENILWYIREVIKTCKSNYPDKRIVFMLWPSWLDVILKFGQEAVSLGYRSLGDEKFRFTKEQVSQANVPGIFIKPILDTISVFGIEEVMIYGEGNFPWNDNYEWVQETIKWFQT